MRIDSGATPDPWRLGHYRMAFSTVVDGNMERSTKDRVLVEANRRAFLQRVGLPKDKYLLRIRPAHSPNIELVSQTKCGLLREVWFGDRRVSADFDFYDQAADGAVVTDASVAVMLVSGDCAPVMIWDKVAGLHGIVHVGLLGALNGAVLQLSAVIEKIGSFPGNLNVYIGPSISKESYDVSRSGLWTAIADQVFANDLLRDIREKFLLESRFDLRRAIVAQLLSIGIESENIQLFGPCTAAIGSNFYSHYSAKQAGTPVQGFASVIWQP